MIGAVPYEEKERMVRQVFSSVAHNYDVMNDLMSFGMPLCYAVLAGALDISCLRGGKCMQLLGSIGLGIGDWTGLHRLWKDDFVRSIGIPSYASVHNSQPRTLDVAGGTGDIAFRIIHELHSAGLMTASQPEQQSEEQRQVIICDINSNMLEVREWQMAACWGIAEKTPTNKQNVRNQVGRERLTNRFSEEIRQQVGFVEVRQ